MSTSKPYKNGFVIMKALPFHRGHAHLIEQGNSFCEFLTVLVCSINSEPLAGHLRFRWVRDYVDRMKLKNVVVYHFSEVSLMNSMFTDIRNLIISTNTPLFIPQVPEEHPLFWEIWSGIVKKYVFEPDVIVSSEKYGDIMAEKMNIKHICVDEERKLYPVSGTAIRSRPLKYWRYLPDEVQCFYRKRVAIVGGESVGKTTMVQKLAKHFDSEYVPEYGRFIWDKIKDTLQVKDFLHIGRRQIAWQQALYPHAGSVLFCDTEPITTKVFLELFYPKIQPSNRTHGYEITKQTLNLLITNNPYDYYLLLNSDVPFVQDGTRNFADNRSEHFFLIKKELDKLNCHYSVIKGSSYDDRVRQAISVISGLYF